MAKEFELREERMHKSKHLPGGIVTVSERIVKRSKEDDISPKFHNLQLGQRRNVRDDEDFTVEIIYSVVRVK
jgi:hypothetical protein